VRWQEQLRQTQQIHSAKKQHDHAFGVLQVGPAHAASHAVRVNQRARSIVEFSEHHASLTELPDTKAK
jgi:hypothetical protein